MRVTGLILALLGGLWLGYYGLAAGAGFDPAPTGRTSPLPPQPVLAGIALTVGLMLMTLGGDRRGAA